MAHTLNGKLEAVLTTVNPAKPMSFSTLNGDVDVTLPASVKANVKMKSDNRGHLYGLRDCVEAHLADASGGNA